MEKWLLKFTEQTTEASLGTNLKMVINYPLNLLRPRNEII